MEKLGNLREVVKKWTVDHLEMILVALNCLKFFLKEQLGLNQWDINGYGMAPNLALR